MVSDRIPTTDLRQRLLGFGRCVCDGARLMVGQGNYETYLDHVRKTHPDREPMSAREYFRNRENARFGGGNGSGFRCC